VDETRHLRRLLEAAQPAHDSPSRRAPTSSRSTGSRRTEYPARGSARTSPRQRAGGRAVPTAWKPRRKIVFRGSGRVPR
jgi:hypothetical protein